VTGPLSSTKSAVIPKEIVEETPEKPFEKERNGEKHQQMTLTTSDFENFSNSSLKKN